MIHLQSFDMQKSLFYPTSIYWHVARAHKLGHSSVPVQNQNVFRQYRQFFRPLTFSFIGYERTSQVASTVGVIILIHDVKIGK